MTDDTHSVLVVTPDSKISSMIGAMLIPPVFDVKLSSDFNEARRLSAERTFNIIIVDFADGQGTDFALDIADSPSTILLMAPAQHFDQISYKIEPYGILTVSTPFDQFYFYNIIKIAIAVQYKVQILSSKATKLKEKMEEIRLVNRAKLLLIEKKSMSEADAHRYLEKTAMDTGKKRIAVANDIIRELS